MINNYTMSHKRLNEKLLISKFILSLNEKNFSKANKVLQKIVESKLNKRLNKTINNL
jgi:BarA-like signal transduction histidine kinase